MWAAMSLKKEAEIETMGIKRTLQISGMADGCTGCMLVFATKEQAAAYVGPGGSIVQIGIIKEEDE
jgi:threonine dehydrogenase-like Zn-dependent dehydrogenase